LALWPDNQAHQIFWRAISGAIPKLLLWNSVFSYPRERRTKFRSMGLRGHPPAVSNLGGRVDTRGAQLGFSSHPFDKLHVHGEM
jgi:hypothetical protein